MDFVVRKLGGERPKVMAMLNEQMGPLRRKVEALVEARACSHRSLLRTARHCVGGVLKEA